MNPTQRQRSQSRRASKSESSSAQAKGPPPTHAIDVLNFFLIWITLVLALSWPYQLFLFSYIVIGPWHYLTEINWLDKQKYFLRPKDGRVFAWSMVALVLALSAASRFSETGKWA